MRSCHLTFSILILSGIAITSAFAETPKYAVLHKFALEGDGGWDYLSADSSGHRLFISRGNHVQVMDTVSGKLVGDIKDTTGVHGIALVSKFNRGFTSNGRDNSVTTFDLASLKEIAKIPVGQNPDAIIFDAASNRVFTFNGQSGDATAINVATDKVAGTIKLHGKPEFPASDGKGSIFVNIEDTSEIQQIDTKKLTVTKTWSLAPGDGPSGLAMDVKNHLVFSVCGNNLMAISDTTAGKLAQTAKIGSGPDAAAFDPKWNVAFSSNGQDGTLTVVAKQANGKYAPVQTLSTQRGARTMALDAKSHKIYLITAEFDAPAPGSRRGRMKPGSAVILVVGPK